MTLRGGRPARSISQRPAVTSYRTNSASGPLSSPKNEKRASPGSTRELSSQNARSEAPYIRVKAASVSTAVAMRRVCRR